MAKRQVKITPETLAESAKLRAIWEEKKTALNLRQAQFGEQHGIGTQSAVGQFLRGETPISMDAAIGFARGLGVQISDFSERLASQATGIANAVTTQHLAPSPTPDPGEPAVRVPLLANAGSMGPGNDSHSGDVIVGAISLSPAWLDTRIRPTSNRALGFIHAYGDSMSPTFEDGDILLVDTGLRDPSGADGVYVLEANSRIFIKRVTEKLSGGHIVTSDNPSIKTADELNGDSEVQVKGKVVWVWNGRKL